MSHFFFSGKLLSVTLLTGSMKSPASEGILVGLCRGLIVSLSGSVPAFVIAVALTTVAGCANHEKFLTKSAPDPMTFDGSLHPRPHIICVVCRVKLEA